MCDQHPALNRIDRYGTGRPLWRGFIGYDTYDLTLCAMFYSNTPRIKIRASLTDGTVDIKMYLQACVLTHTIAYVGQQDCSTEILMEE